MALPFVNQVSSRPLPSAYGRREGGLLDYIGQRRRGETGLFWASIFCGGISLFLGVLLIYKIVTA